MGRHHISYLPEFQRWAFTVSENIEAIINCLKKVRKNVKYVGFFVRSGNFGIVIVYMYRLHNIIVVFRKINELVGKDQCLIDLFQTSLFGLCHIEMFVLFYIFVHKILSKMSETKIPQSPSSRIQPQNKITTRRDYKMPQLKRAK